MNCAESGLLAPAKVVNLRRLWKVLALRGTKVDRILTLLGSIKQREGLVLGVCRWQEQPVGGTTLRDLLEQTSSFVPKKGKWIVDYLGFSASGWTMEAETLAQDVQVSGAAKANWQSESFKLFNLEDISADLARWMPSTG